MSRARELGLSVSGAKFVLLDRIRLCLDTGEKVPHNAKGKTQQSRFDWRTEDLTIGTVITDNYRNTQNVRGFFQGELGADFRFSIALMEWIQANVGKTLGEACDAYHVKQILSRDSGFRAKIKSHNQFNQYAWDFIEANPEMGMQDVRQCWVSKTELPLENGRYVYDSSDLDFLLASPSKVQGKVAFD